MCTHVYTYDYVCTFDELNMLTIHNKNVIHLTYLTNKMCLNMFK